MAQAYNDHFTEMFQYIHFFYADLTLTSPMHGSLHWFAARNELVT